MIKGVLQLHSLLLKCMNLDFGCSTVRRCVSTPADAKPLTKCMLLVGSLLGAYGILQQAHVTVQDANGARACKLAASAA